MDKKADFIAAAILDTQATIRAVDVKVAAFLVAILSPLGNVNRIFAHLGHFGNQSPRWIFLFIVVAFLVTWVFALVALVRAIGAIDNPSRHIINSSSLKGSFYAGGLYKLGIVDVFLNREIIKASTDPMTFAAQIPGTSAEMEVELVFEQMKLVYIRDIKFNRLNWGMRFSLAWLVLGIGIFVFSKYCM